MIQLWTVPLDIPRPDLLSPDETARALRFRFDPDRVRWTRARSALRAILAACTGETPAALRFQYGDHGKPALAISPQIHFNLSHAGDYALVAVSREFPVGVDLERFRPDVDIAALLRRLGETGLPPTTRELYQRWTAREARSKVTGGRLFDKPSPDVHAIDAPAPPGYAASVAMAAPPDMITIQSIPLPEAESECFKPA